MQGTIGFVRIPSILQVRLQIPKRSRGIMQTERLSSGCG